MIEYHDSFGGEPALLSTPGGRGRDVVENRNVSPLVSAFQPIRFERAYFAEISSGSAEVAIDTGEAGWYLLRRIVAGQTPIAYTGAEFSLAPTDVNGGATPRRSAHTAQAWGDGTGTRAAIVVAKNLPLAAGGWRSKRAYIPGLSTSEADLLSVDGAPEYIHVEPFPAGKFTDAQQSRTKSLPRYVPNLVWLTEGESLDVALVVDRAYIDSMAASKSIIGYALISLHLMPLSGFAV